MYDLILMINFLVMASLVVITTTTTDQHVFVVSLDIMVIIVLVSVTIPVMGINAPKSVNVTLRLVIT